MKKIEREIQALRKFSKLPMQATLAGMIVASPFAFGADTEQKAQGETVLAPVEVTGAKQGGPAQMRSYNQQVTTVGRTPTAQRDIPQTVTVVTSKLIDDQHATSMREALRNVAGLTFNAGEGGRTGDNVTIRGFSAATDLYLDGVRDIGQYNRDLFNTERVEILKGPASMLFGRGSTGGVVNQVSKAPYAGQERDLSVSIGTYDNYRIEADLNEQITESSAARLNIMGEKANSFRDEVETQRWGIAPSYSVGLGQPTEFTLSWFYMQEDNVPDFGVPFQNGKPFETPNNRFYGLSDIDYEKNTTSVVSAVVQHKFSRELRIRNTTRYGRYERDLAPTAPRLGTTDRACGTIVERPCVTRGRPMRAAEDTIVSNQFDIIAKSNALGMEHDILSGFELGKEDNVTQRWRTPSSALPPTTVGNPNPHQITTEPIRQIAQDVSFNASTVGVYFQDLVKVAENWKILAGLRWDRFSGSYYRTLTPYENDIAGTPEVGDFDRTNYIWSYRTGVIFQPSETASYYTSLGTSFNPSAEAYALDKRGSNTPPEKNRNMELGAKWDWLNGDLSVRTSIFRSEKTHERNTDPLKLDVAVLSGKRHTDGVELEIAGRITPKWEVFTGMTYMKSEIDEASGDQKGTEGKRPINTPDYTVNLWSTYSLAQAWKVGGGFNAVGQRYANAQNTNELPSYVVWDAMLAYEQEKYDIQLNVYNIFDEKYYEGLYGGHTTFGKARTAVVTLNYHF